LALDTGDALIGGGWLGEQTRGAVIVDGMNLMGYDAMALGPYELTLGLELLQRRMEEAQFPMLSANVVLSDTGELMAEPYAVLEVADRRLGVIGLTRVPAEPVPGFRVLDPQQAAVQYVPEVAQQADMVVILSNVRYRPARALAEAVPGIDLLVAALPGQLPSQAARAPGTQTLVVTAEQPLARHTGRRVGQLRVTVGSDNSLGGESWASVPMDKTLVDDLLMQNLLDKYRQ
jgi:2',3'-cyclic-nucleotide 2'-phosphodiesterase/3'-nucleotidase